MSRPLRLALALVALAAPAALADDIPRPEHPTPDAVREHWSNLNGTWEFRFDADDQGRRNEWFRPGAEGFDRSIVVPFPWESELSGIHETDGPKIGWYRRTFTVPDDFPEADHVWLRFGAVDYDATVWVNGQEVAHHQGGYTPFEADITDALKAGEENTLVVRAFDPTDPSLPVGKQVGWYTTTSGIWQTVWLEARPKTFMWIDRIITEVDPARVQLNLGVVNISGPGEYTFAVRSDDPTVQAQSATGRMLKVPPPLPLGKKDERTAVIPDSPYGLCVLKVDVRDAKLWSPESPHLYDVTLELKDSDDKVVDSVKTYFGLRTIARGKFGDEPFERVLLNGKPVYLRGALDQSFNPQGIYTAPSDEFLKHDIELAKSFGLNFLRIHIKPEEPRRLYWADKLGMMIMEDMPNTWEQNPRARDAWENTMRGVIPRDCNHPSIFAWVAFNETWGLGRPDNYKASEDTQKWVQSMVSEIRKLDPTRLVEDNSPCNYDHVEGTDLNSWHFYIDDYEEASRHVAEVVERSEPGSAFNYCPGDAMNSAPLINSEYGSVSAGGGDRDISWGFRYLTTILRKYPKIQGYVYTELDDIEWEHNGYVDYDRSAKSFAYDAFVPGMTVADLNGADFVGFDAPPAIVAKSGATIRVPLFVSHYSGRTEAPTLRWWITGTDGAGKVIEIEPQTREVDWEPFDVTEQKPLAFQIEGPFVGALALVLEDAKGGKIAANFVNLVVEGDAPRVERAGDHAALLRFAPEDYAASRWADKAPAPEGKVAGRGKGSFTYRIKVPESIARAKPESFTFLVEAGARGGRDQVDWKERVNPQDYPQTDARPNPTILEASLNGASIGRVELDDDFADAFGVLSHLRKTDHGSHGELITFRADLPEAARRAIADGKPLELTLAVPDDAENAGGLSVYGATMGAFPLDPTLRLTTEAALPEDLGVDPAAPVAIDTAASRRVSLLPTGETGRRPGPSWAYTTEDPGAGWNAPDFDDSGWRRGRPGFGTEGTPAVAVGTRWDSPDIWLRIGLDLPTLGDFDALTLRLFHDEDVQIFVNGRPLHRARGYVTGYGDVALSPEQKGLFREGRNVVAVHCRQTGGGQGVDVGLTLEKGD